MQQIKLDVFGRLVLATRNETGWKIYYLGEEGKRRPAPDIAVPPEIGEADLDKYLADLCHEWCTANSPSVERLP
jgi:hypothetical protein